MKTFFYIDRIQQWINIFKIITIFREGIQWHIELEGKEAVILNDSEYGQLKELLNQEPPKPQDKPE